MSQRTSGSRQRQGPRPFYRTVSLYPGISGFMCFDAHYMVWVICMIGEFFTVESFDTPNYYIKANNIVDYDENHEGEIFIKVQISDLEDTVIVSAGKWLRGPLCGNAIWGSPEGWCESRQN
ncbi:unnamed protein product [Penicillium glandicola]